MTGIFQIFDRYKAKAIVKTERRKIKSGESDIKTIPPYYVHDGRNRVPDSSDRRSSEASRDSRRPSSADVSEAVLKALTPFLKEPQAVQKPYSSGRPSVDSPKPRLSAYKSSSPREAPIEPRDSFKNPEIYSSDAATPRPTGPSTSSVDTNRSNRDGRRRPPRTESKERSKITLLENLKEVPDDAREVSQAISQIRKSADRSPHGGARGQSPSVSRKDFYSSGDEQDSKYVRRDQSSGDERYGHVHPSSREAHRYSSATEHHVYDYGIDHHRPQFPVEGKNFLQGRRSQHSASHHHVMEMARYMSSGDEIERRSNMSTGDDKGAYRLHRCLDQESSRSRWPVDRDGTRYYSAGDVFKEDSSGEERVQRPHPRRHHHQGHQKHRASREGRRRVVYDVLGRELRSSGDEMPGHRQAPHRHSSIYYAGYRHSAEAKEHQRYLSAGEENRHQTSSASKAARPSTSGFEDRRYQSSGDGRGGQRRVAVFKRHDPPLEYNWKNESSDEGRREVFPQQHRRSSIDPRRFSSATDAHRRYSVSNEEQRYSSSHDDRRRDRSRSSVRNGSKYDPSIEGWCNSQNFRSHGDWGYEEANVPGALKESSRRNLSVEPNGEHRRRSSNSCVTSSKESLNTHSKPKVKEGGYSKDLPPRSSGSRINTVSPRNAVDLRDLARLNMQVRESSQTPALRDVYRAEKASLAPDLSAESVAGSFDLREMLRAIDFKESQWNSEKVSARNSFDGRDPPRTSNVSRVSADSRQYQSSTPRLSVDGREHVRASSLHSSRASSVDAQVQMRTNSMDSSSTSGEFKRRGPSVVARLMGLAELPGKGFAREGKSLQRLLSSTPPAEASSPPGKTQRHLNELAQQMKQVRARLHQDSQMYQKTETRPKLKSKAKSRTQSKSRSPPPAPASLQDKDTQGSLNQHQGYGIFGRQLEMGSPLPRQPMSPKHHQMEGMPKKRPQDLSSGDLDQRLRQLRIKNSIQEHRTLKQILEAMHLKGLLHPPPKKPSKSPRAELNETKAEAERPLSDFESKSLGRVNHNEYQEKLDFEDLIRLDGEVHEELAIDKVQPGEASIVVMKPLNYQTAIPPSATKEVDMSSESAGRSGFAREKIEIGHRRRESERRIGSSGKLSRSHSLDLPDQIPAIKVQVDDLSFANVMLSWRERIAADAAKKATGDLAEAKTLSRAKSPSLKHRSQDASTSARNSDSTEKRVGSPRMQKIPVEEYNREDYETASRNVLSDIAQENADEDSLRVVDRSKSDLQLSAKTVEALAAMDASSVDRVPAQVAVLRSKRASSKSSRSKEKLRTSLRADPRSNSTAMTSFSTPEPWTDQHIQSPSHSCNDLKTVSSGPDSNSQRECTSMSAEDSSRIMPKKRKTAEPDDQAKVTLEDGVKGVISNEEDGRTHVGQLAPLQCTLVAYCEAEKLQDAKMDDAFDDASEAHTPEGFSSGRDKCFSDEGAFSLLGADLRSPVSVLDSPIFQEGFHLEELSTSPDSVKSIVLRLEDAKDPPKHDVPCEHESEALTSRARISKDAFDPLRDLYTKVARSIELGEKEIYSRQSSIDLRTPFPSVATESAGDPSQGKLYVQAILTESGLSDASSLLPKDDSEVIEFDVFTRKEEELQTAELERIDRGELEKTEEKRYKESLDRRLIFDCMNEIVERKMSPFLNPQPWGVPVVTKKPYGQRLLNEVWGELRDMHLPTNVSDDALYAVLQKDFMRKGFQWLDFSVEVGDVGCELECLILQELVEEIVQEMKNINPQSSSSLELLQPLSPASSPRASENSEIRRRELLDKTRRDLLAWHVQYQQL